MSSSTLRKATARMGSLPCLEMSLACIDNITIPEGRRQISEDKVAALMDSISKVGLLNKIHLRAPTSSDGTTTTLLLGAHRLEACKRLGWKTIPCSCVDTDDLHAELAEIDENLCRNELDPAERAALSIRRVELAKQIVLAEEPVGQLGQQVPGSSKPCRRGRGEKTGPDAGSAAHIAKLTKRPRRSVARDIRRGKALGAETLRKVAGTSLAKGRELDALAELPANKRTALVDRAAAGEKVSARRSSEEATGLELPDDLADRQALRAFRKWRADHGDRPKLAYGQDAMDHIEHLLEEAAA